MSTATTTPTASASAIDTSAAIPVVGAKSSRGRPYAVLGAIVAVGVAGYGLMSWISRGRESTDDAQVEADVVNVSARVGGTVAKVRVADNQVVKKGDVIAEIDPADFVARAKQAAAQLEAARAQAEAADAQVAIVAASSKGGLAAAEAQLSGTATSVASADAQIQAARASLARAEADAAQAETDLARAESLHREGAIPQSQYDSAKSIAQSARAAVALAQAQLSAAEDGKRTAQTHVTEARGRVEQSAPVEAQLAVARANAELARANVTAAEAAKTLADLQLSYTTIVSPADGHLAKVTVREGAQLQAGQVVVSVVPRTTYVVANFKETQVGAMRAGQRAEIVIDAFPGRTFEGTVESTSPGTGARFSLLPADNATGNFVKVVQRMPVRIAWANVSTDVPLAAGLSAYVTVIAR
jgi:membrane fusion protein (multidrug efflux system)